MSLLGVLCLISGISSGCKLADEFGARKRGMDKWQIGCTVTLVVDGLLDSMF